VFEVGLMGRRSGSLSLSTISVSIKLISRAD